MNRKFIKIIILALAISLAMLLIPQASRADEENRPRVLSITLLGDSYSAGNGAGNYDTASAGSYRSSNNWANRYRDWLNNQGIYTRLTNLAHSGHTSTELINEQVAQIPRDTDLVMFTIGGNDGGFEKVVENCFFLGLRSPALCRAAVTDFQSFVNDLGPDGLRTKIRACLEAVSTRLKSLGRPNAEIVLMGYPNLVLPDSHKYILSGPFNGGVRSSYRAGEAILAAAAAMNATEKEAVDSWNQEYIRPPLIKIPVTYIDSIQNRFAWHEPDPSFFTKNNKRWINEFFETEGHLGANGNTEATPNKEPLNWYHPNKIGHEKLAEALIEKISIPPSAHPAGASPNDDVPNPEIRETVSAWIQGHYAHQIGKPLTLDARGSYSDHGAPVKYEWDLDGDGRYEIESTEPTLTHTWESEYVGDIHLRVTGPEGFTDVASTDVMITNDGDSTPYDQDNCPEVNNHGQTDYDGDGIGDECDATPGYPQEDQPGVGEGPAPSDPSPSPSPSPTPSATPTPIPTPTRSPSPTPTPTTAPTSTPSPSVSASATPTEPPSIDPSISPDPSTVPIPSLTPSGPPAPTGDPSQLPPSVPVPTSATPTGAPTQVPAPPPSSRPAVKPGLPKTGN